MDSQSKIGLSGVAETTLIPIVARVMESRRKKRLFTDNKAVEIYESLPYDFAKFRGKGAKKMSLIGAVIRTAILDDIGKQFLQQHPNAFVLNLGAGLDARFFRLDTGLLDWFEIDLPPVIALRRRFFKESARYHFIARSLFDDTWLEAISVGDSRPVLAIAEGIIPYFKEEQISNVFAKLQSHCPGSTVTFDCLGSWFVNRYRRHAMLEEVQGDVQLQCGIDTAEDLRRICPKIAEVQVRDYFRGYRSRWGFLGNLGGLFPQFKRQFNIWTVRFE